MSKIQEYQEVIEFLNKNKIDSTPHHEELEDPILKNKIPYEYYKKIVRLTKDKIDFFILEDFLDYMDPLVNYIVDNLHCFNIYEFSDLDPCQFELHSFLWNITNDPVIPYLLGLNTKSYKPLLETIADHPIRNIYIRLFFEEHFYENKEKWSMTILYF